VNINTLLLVTADSSLTPAHYVEVEAKLTTAARWPAWIAAIPVIIAITWNLYQTLSALLPNLYLRTLP
jgi:hypothetical protein